MRTRIGNTKSLDARPAKTKRIRRDIGCKGDDAKAPPVAGHRGRGGGAHHRDRCQAEGPERVPGLRRPTFPSRETCSDRGWRSADRRKTLHGDVAGGPGPTLGHLLKGPITFKPAGSDYRLEGTTRVGARLTPEGSTPLTPIWLASPRGFEPPVTAVKGCRMVAPGSAWHIMA